MKRLILLFFITIPLRSVIVVVTDKGEIAYSTNGGAGFTFISNPAPFSDAMDITSNKDGHLYVLTRQGEIYYSTDGGVNWSWVKNLPISDGVAIWVDASDHIYVLTESGDLYTNYSGIWELKRNLGLSDFVDFIPDLNPGNFLGITRSGDVVRVVVGSNFTSYILGNAGFSNIVSGATSSGAVFLLTREGDILKSTNSVNYTPIGSISMFGMEKMVAVGGDSLYAAHESGDIARSPDGVNWIWRGSVNQLYIKGLTTDKLASLGVSDYYFALSLSEEGIVINFFGYKRWKIYKDERDGFRFLVEVRDGNVYIDKDVEGGRRYGYKVYADGKWFGPLYIVYPYEFKERIIGLFPVVCSDFLNLSLYIRTGGIKEIEIFSSDGRKVWSLERRMGRGKIVLKINLEKFKKGVYILRFKQDKVKFIKM